MKRALILAATAALLSGCAAQPVQPPKPEGYSLGMDNAYSADALRLMQGLTLCKQIAAGWTKTGDVYFPPNRDPMKPITKAEGQATRQKEDVCEANYKRKSAALWESQPQALRDHYDEQARRQRETDAAIEAEAQR